MRKILIISINILLIVTLVLLIFKPFEKLRLIDRYIRYNITSELSMLRLVIDDLEEELIVDDTYMTLERDAFLTVLKDAQYQVFLIDKSIGKLGLLNKNFDFSLNGLSDYLFNLETTVSADKEPSEEEIKVLISLIELMDECSVSTQLSYYPDDGTGFTRLEVPEKTQLLFDEISKLEDKIQYSNLSENEKQIHDLIEEQKVINDNYVEDIGTDIVKLIPIDLENPVLANGDILDIEFEGEVGSGEEVSVNVEFGIVSFERGLGVCDDFQIYTISEGEEILYILFTSSKENDDDYRTNIFNYNPNKGNVFGMINHVGNALYYDNKDNIIFWSYGLKAKGFREDIPLELKYHYNIIQEVRREIKDEEILDILKDLTIQ